MLFLGPGVCMKSHAPVSIKLNSAQRALIRAASGKDVAKLGIEPAESGSGWLYSAGGKEFWLLKNPDPEAYLAAQGTDRPRIEPRHTSFRLRIGESHIHQTGVFAEERIPARRNVIEYTGERINPVEAFRRTKDGKKTYLFGLDKFWRVDGAVGGSGAEFINHSCEPNLRWRKLRERVLCQSTRPIKAGEELTIDYHFSSKAPKVHCSCGSPNCRGTINVKARRNHSRSKRRKP